MLNLGEELRGIRKKLGKTQKEIAEEYGLPQTTWASYEVGKATPRMGILFSLAEKGYPIKGLTTNVMDDLIEDGKISKAEYQKRLEIARAMAEKAPLDTPVDNKWAEKVDAEYKSQISAEGRLLDGLKNVIQAVIEAHIKTIADHESRLAALEERLKEEPALPEAKYPPETGDGGGYTAEAEPEYGEEEPTRTVNYWEDVAAGPPIGQSEDTSYEIDVPLRYIKTRPSDYYALRVQGNSMIDALIPDGSMVLIRKSDAPRDSAIQVVRIDGRATLKRMREEEDHSWTLCFEDGTGRTIPLGDENHVQGDFMAVLPPTTRPRMRE